MNNQFSIDNILIPLSKDTFIKYVNIIGIISVDEVNNSDSFKSKIRINEPLDKSLIHSYIYCNDNFLVATTMSVSALIKKIDSIVNDYNNKNIFRI